MVDQNNMIDACVGSEMNTRAILTCAGSRMNVKKNRKERQRIKGMIRRDGKRW